MFKIFRRKEYKGNVTLPEMPEDMKTVFARIFYVDNFGVGRYCLAERTFARRWVCYDTNHRVRETITEDAEGFKVLQVISGHDDEMRDIMYDDPDGLKYKTFPIELEIPEHIKNKLKEDQEKEESK